MTGPRNRVAFARGQAIRRAIRDYLDAQVRLHPYSRRPTWREIQAYLRTRRFFIERSAICHHLQQIELDAELDRTDADLSNPEASLPCAMTATCIATE